MRKCEHGIYWPDGDAIALSCQSCNPNPAASTLPADIPIFNRRGSLKLTVTGKLPKCPNCNDTSILAMSRDGICKSCGVQYEIVAATNLRANNAQLGLCDQCGSGVHYEKDRKTWECADCGHLYRAPRRNHHV